MWYSETRLKASFFSTISILWLYFQYEKSSLTFFFEKTSRKSWYFINTTDFKSMIDFFFLFNFMSIFLIETTNIWTSFCCDKVLNKAASIAAMLTKLFLYDLLSICFFFNENSILVNLSFAIKFFFCFIVDWESSFFLDFDRHDVCWSFRCRIAFDKNFAKTIFSIDFDHIW